MPRGASIRNRRGQRNKNPHAREHRRRRFCSLVSRPACGALLLRREELPMPHESKDQKNGDAYVTVPVDHFPNAARCSFGIWAFILAWIAIRRGGLLGT